MEGYKIFWADNTHLYSGIIKMPKEVGAVSPDHGDESKWGFTSSIQGLGIYFHERNWLKKHLEDSQPGVKVRGKTLVYAKVEITKELPRENNGRYNFKQNCKEFKILELLPWTDALEREAKKYISDISGNQNQGGLRGLFEGLAQRHDEAMNELQQRGQRAMGEMDAMSPEDQRDAIDSGRINPMDMIMGLFGRAGNPEAPRPNLFSSMLIVDKLERVDNHTILIVKFKDHVSKNPWLINPEEMCAIPIAQNSPDLEFLTRKEVLYNSLSPQAKEMLDHTGMCLMENQIKGGEEKSMIGSMHADMSRMFNRTMATIGEGVDPELETSMPMTTTNSELGIRYVSNSYNKVFKIYFMKKDASGAPVDINDKRIRLTKLIPGLEAAEGSVLRIMVMGELLMLTNAHNQSVGFIRPAALRENDNFVFV